MTPPITPSAVPGTAFSTPPGTDGGNHGNRPAMRAINAGQGAASGSRNQWEPSPRDHGNRSPP
jgi:hypothetical protein